MMMKTEEINKVIKTKEYKNKNDKNKLFLDDFSMY